MPKKMLWEVGVYSRLSERLIRDGRDSAKRVVSDTYTPKIHGRNRPFGSKYSHFTLASEHVREQVSRIV